MNGGGKHNIKCSLVIRDWYHFIRLQRMDMILKEKKIEGGAVNITACSVMIAMMIHTYKWCVKNYP